MLSLFGFVLAASEWYEFHVRFALPTTLWLFRREVVVSIICCWFVFFLYDTFGILCMYWNWCVRIPQLLYNWMKSIIQSEAFVHSFFSGPKQQHTASTQIGIYSHVHAHTCMYRMFTFAKQKIQHNVEIFVMDSVCVWERVNDFKTGETNICTFACVYLSCCLNGSRTMYEYHRINRVWSDVEQRAVLHLKCTVAWSGAEHSVHCTCYFTNNTICRHTTSTATAACINNRMAVCFGVRSTLWKGASS